MGRSRSPPRDGSRSPGSKSRSRSRSRSADGETRAALKKFDLALQVCRDFTRGRCTRPPSDCRYAHPPSSVSIDGNEVTVCYDSLRDRCARGYGCRYFHPPPHLRAKMQEAIGIQGARYLLPHQARSYDGLYAPPPTFPTSLHCEKETIRPTLEVCRDFVRGRCSRRAEECRFAHHIPGSGDGDYAIVCQDYLRGKCQRVSCRYFHAPNHLKSQIKDRRLGFYPEDDDRGYRSASFGSHGYDGGLYEYQTSRNLPVDDYYHYQAAPLPPPPPPPLAPPPLRTSKDEDKLPICRDFYMRGNCSRGSACRFVHPESYLQVVDNHVTVCRDATRGHCKREQCRFYHPSGKRSSASDLRNGTASSSLEATSPSA